MAFKKNLYLVFTTLYCPKCKEIKEKLKEQGIEYKEISVMKSQKNRELAKKYNVQAAGTVINATTGERIEI